MFLMEILNSGVPLPAAFTDGPEIDEIVRSKISVIFKERGKFFGRGGDDEIRGITTINLVTFLLTLLLESFKLRVINETNDKNVHFI